MKLFKELKIFLSEQNINNRAKFKLLVLLAVILPAQNILAGHPKVEKYSKSPNAHKITVKLLDIDQKIKKKGMSLSQAIGKFPIVKSANGLMLDIKVSHIDERVRDRFNIPGIKVYHFSEKYNRIALTIDDSALLYELANIPEVIQIAPEYGRITRAGNVTSRADRALNADLARMYVSVDGTGQTIGILSDSFARTSGVRDAGTTPAIGVQGMLAGSKPQDSGDLPATVELRRDDALNDDVFPLVDEGAAMAELVYDIAPNSNIAFYTAYISQAAFAEGITDLCTTQGAGGAGATVVVDDVIYFAEPMYQDGIIAQAAAACVASGVPYFSAAGNDANKGLRQDFSDIDAANDNMEIPPDGADLHDWGDGDGYLDVTLPPGAYVDVVLQWNQPSDSVSQGAGSQIDLDLYITLMPDQTEFATPLGIGVDIQGTTGSPAGDALEIASYANTTSSEQTVFVAIDHFAGNQDTIPQNGATPVEFRLVFFDSGNITYQGIDDATSSFGGPTIYGHVMAAGVTSVAAVAWYEAPRYDPAGGPSPVTDPEFFTSRGGSLTIQFDAGGNFNTRTSFEPDISAVDGNNTTFYGADIDLGGYEGEPDLRPNFFGTSAAAPNAAAVVALMRQANPTLTPAEINYYLSVSAIDITGARAAAGDDDVTGVGLIDAQAAFALMLILNPIGNKTVTEGNTLSFTVAVLDTYTKPVTLTAVSTTVSPITFDPAAGIFSWTPTYGDIGTHSVTITATDATDTGLSDTEIITITVNQKPVRIISISGISGCSLTGGQTINDPIIPVLVLISLVYLVRRRCV